MELVIDNIIIKEPIENIIYTLQKEANWNVFKDIQQKENYLRVTCPFHKDGNEANPSCSIFTGHDSATVMPGTYHCFTCGTKGTLYQLVSFVLGISDAEAKEWLINKYGSILYEDDSIFYSKTFLPETKEENKFLDESILDQYKYYHPYLEGRKISFETAKKFLVGYNQYKNTITFPVWDINNNLVMITERSINTKHFYIPEGTEKPVYLLNYIIKENPKFVIVCESQINALTCWSYGLPAVALFGTGTQTQYEQLIKSGINNFVLCFDGDEAGRKGARRFISSMPKNRLIIDIKMPDKKDVNDLTKEEFFNILKNNYVIS